MMGRRPQSLVELIERSGIAPAELERKYDVIARARQRKGLAMTPTEQRFAEVMREVYARAEKERGRRLGRLRSLLAIVLMSLGLCAMIWPALFFGAWVFSFFSW
jgi:hypothetical protein